MTASVQKSASSSIKGGGRQGKPPAGRKSSAQERKSQQGVQNAPPARGERPQPPAERAGVELVIPPHAAARIGVISDTHGFLDPGALQAFAGVDLIIHAGDIVDPHIIAALTDVAPTVAVSGNIDGGELAATLPRELIGTCGGVRFVVGHKRKRLMKRLEAGKYAGPDGRAPDVVIFGHEHVPSAAWVDGTLLLNPGTASSPDEEDDGPTVAILESMSTGLAVCFVPLRRRPLEEADTD